MADKKLTQSQIDDLVKTMNTNGEEAVEEMFTGKTAKSFTEYDFDRPEKFREENIKSLFQIADTFAKGFSQMITASLGLPIQFKPNQNIEQIPYSSEYVDKIMKNFFVFCVTDLGQKNLGLGKIIIEFDLNMIIPIHRKLMGAKNVNIEEKRRALTEIEEISLKQWIKELMFPQLSEAFRTIVDLNLNISSIETDANRAKVTSSADMVALVTFDVYIGEEKTTMRLVIPYMSVEPIIEDLTTENIYEYKLEDDSVDQIDVLEEHLGMVKEKVDVELGTTQITLNELLEFSEGDVLLLDQKVNEDLKGYIADKPKFSCRMGKRENRVAIKVTGFAEKEEFGERGEDNDE